MNFFYGYVITNNITGKEYVGITSKTVEERWRKHLSSMKKNQKYYLYRSMHKYGVCSFTVKEVIRTNSWETICKWEIATIQTRNTFAPNGYNMTLGGEGSTGHKRTTEQNKIHSKFMKQLYMKNPILRKEISIKIKQSYKDNPNLTKEKSERMKKRYKDNPYLKSIQKEKTKQMHKNNPEIAKKQSIMMKEIYENNSEKREIFTKRMKQFHKDNPDFNKTNRKRFKNGNAIPVLCFNKFFRSTREASRYFDMPETTIRRKIKNAINGSQKLIKDQKYDWEVIT